ncbi:MAG: phosphate ABC transporter permease subunit PstC [Planctomycetota bacterium]
MATDKLKGREPHSVAFSIKRRKGGSRAKEAAIHAAFLACAVVSILTTLGFLGILIYETVGFFREVSFMQFFGDTRWTPLFVSKHFGIWPLLAGTLLVTLIAMIVALPVGLLCAVYLSEYSHPGVRKVVKPMLEILAGIPTVVYGYFALLFVTPALQHVIPGMAGFNALSPGIVMGVMILPIISSLSEDAMYAVPQSLREGAYALGSSKLQVSFLTVVPAAFSGITAAFILGVSRAIGETMIVAIAAGLQPRLTANPIEPIETMTAYIVQVSLGDTPHGTIEYKTIFAVGMVLFVTTFILNVISQWMRERFREEYT